MDPDHLRDDAVDAGNGENEDDGDSYAQNRRLINRIGHELYLQRLARGAPARDRLILPRSGVSMIGRVNWDQQLTVISVNKPFDVTPAPVDIFLLTSTQNKIDDKTKDNKQNETRSASLDLEGRQPGLKGRNNASDAQHTANASTQLSTILDEHAKLAATFPVPRYLPSRDDDRPFSVSDFFTTSEEPKSATPALPHNSTFTSFQNNHSSMPKEISWETNNKARPLRNSFSTKKSDSSDSYFGSPRKLRTYLGDKEYDKAWRQMKKPAYRNGSIASKIYSPNLFVKHSVSNNEIKSLLLAHAVEHHSTVLTDSIKQPTKTKPPLSASKRYRRRRSIRKRVEYTGNGIKTLVEPHRSLRKNANPRIAPQNDDNTIKTLLLKHTVEHIKSSI